jgi:hypothetical protein
MKNLDTYKGTIYHFWFQITFETELLIVCKIKSGSPQKLFQIQIWPKLQGSDPNPDGHWTRLLILT